MQTKIAIKKEGVYKKSSLKNTAKKELGV